MLHISFGQATVYGSNRDIQSNFGFRTSRSSNNSVFEQKIRDENDSALGQLEQKKKKERQLHVTAKTKRKHFHSTTVRDTIPSCYTVLYCYVYYIRCY